MDKRTRVLNAMNNLPVDHVPVSFWYHFKGEEMLGEACVRAHANYLHATDIDFVKIMCDSYFEYPLPEINEAADWWKLRPVGEDHPYICDQVLRAKQVVEMVGAECCTFYTLFAPFSSIRFGASDELVMKHLREDEEAIKYALDVIAQDNALLAKLLIKEAGCDGVYYCMQGGETSRMSKEDYVRIIEPSDRFVLDKANLCSDNNIMHCCGWAGAKNRMDIWKGYPAKAVNWAVHVEDMSLVEGRKFFGNRCCLGGFETLHQHGTTYQGLLYTATKDEIQDATRNIINEYGKLGLMIGADCILSPDIANERIAWVVQAARSI